MAMGRWQEDTYALAPVDGSERAAAALAHAGFFLGMPFLLPLGVWLIYPAIQPSAYVKHQAVQAMLFHLVSMVASTVFLCVVALAFFGSVLGSWIALNSQAGSAMQWLHASWPITIALLIGFGVFTVWTLVIMVIAVVKAAMGQPYRMPLTGGFGG